MRQVCCWSNQRLDLLILSWKQHMNSIAFHQHTSADIQHNLLSSLRVWPWANWTWYSWFSPANLLPLDQTVAHTNPWDQWVLFHWRRYACSHLWSCCRAIQYSFFYSRLCSSEFCWTSRSSETNPAILSCMRGKILHLFWYLILRQRLQQKTGIEVGYRLALCNRFRVLMSRLSQNALRSDCATGLWFSVFLRTYHLRWLAAQPEIIRSR